MLINTTLIILDKGMLLYSSNYHPLTSSFTKVITIDIMASKDEKWKTSDRIINLIYCVSSLNFLLHLRRLTRQAKWLNMACDTLSCLYIFSVHLRSAAHSSLWSLYSLMLMFMLLLCVFACTINRMLINIGKMVMCLLSLCIHWPRNAANVYSNTYPNCVFGSSISRVLLYLCWILCWSEGEVISSFLSIWH